MLYNKYYREREGVLRDNMDRLAYADFLKNYWWDDFFTVTFRSPRREPYYAISHVTNELGKCNARRGCVVAEPFQSGDLHIHGIIAGNTHGFKPELLLPWDIWSNLFKRFGRTKVELANSQEAVSMYCSKYILKEQNRACDFYSFFGDGSYWFRGRLN